MVTMKCPHCGYVVAEGQATCSQCERPVTTGATGAGGASAVPGSRSALKYLPDEADRGEFRTINESIRIIHARVAEPKERRAYESDQEAGN